MLYQTLECVSAEYIFSFPDLQRGEDRNGRTVKVRCLSLDLVGGRRADGGWCRMLLCWEPRRKQGLSLAVFIWVLEKSTCPSGNTSSVVDRWEDAVHYFWLFFCLLLGRNNRIVGLSSKFYCCCWSTNQMWVSRVIFTVKPWKKTVWIFS